MSPIRYEYRRPITDAPLLQLRDREVEMALDAIAPTAEGPIEHTLLLGDPRSGRTSTLNEIARRAAEEREWVVVTLRPRAAQLDSEGAFIRHLLLASAEAVADRYRDEKPDWYLAWRERVYLRSQAPINSRDLLSSALALAADPRAEIDPLLVEHDLTVLREQAQESGAHGIAVTLDDAGDFTADTGLVEYVLDSLDTAGGWSLLLAGLPVSAQHFMEAVSPCLRRLWPIHLMPFRAQQVMTCLTAPLRSEEQRWVSGDDVGLRRDLVRLTGGNPLEVMLVAHHMWLACKLGENEHFALTPRVLDRVVHELALHTSGGEELLDAAHAIHRLAPEQVPTALELVALSRLTVREIAIARALGVTSRDAETVCREATSDDVDRIAEEVREELLHLEAAGVVQLNPDGRRFVVQGGRAVSVLLKYEARAGRYAAASDRPFGLSSLMTVGRPLMRDVLSNTAARLPDARRLGSGAIEMGTASRQRGSARQAVASLAHGRSLDRIARGDLSLIVWRQEDFDRVAELIGAPELPTLALSSASVSDHQAELEYVELLELASGTPQSDLSQYIADAIDDIMVSVEVADLKWRGAEGVVLTGNHARETLILLQPFAADQAVGRAFLAFRASGDSEMLTHATALAEHVLDVTRSYQPPFGERAMLLSWMLSKSGFLKAFDDSRLGDAERDLRDSLDQGPGENWVTDWNLANVTVRQGRHDEAHAHLTKTSEQIAGHVGEAYVVFFVPGVATIDSMLTVTPIGAEPILRLQRAVLDWDRDAAAPDHLRSYVESCLAIEDAGANKAARMVEAAVAHQGARARGVLALNAGGA